jgi:hypothetical protein
MRLRYFTPVFLILIVIICSTFSCKKDKAPPVDMGYSYFPDRVGSYVVYNVDSFYYNDFTDHIDTFKFLLKEKVESVFQDNQNRPTLRIERYVKYFDKTKPYPTLPWRLRNVWTANLTTSTAEKVEENIRYTKLIFPVTSKNSWNGNSQNTLEPVNYAYLFADLPRTIDKLSFDSVLQVNQQDETNLISKKYYIERYARHVGLIYKHVIDVQSQPDGVPDSLLPVWIATPIMDRVDAGVQYIVTINSYGNE